MITAEGLIHNHPAGEKPMPLVGVRRVLWFWTAALLALPAGGLLSAPARASCGDYVAIGHAAETHAIPATSADPARPPATPSNPTPCHGPTCSRGHPTAPVAPPLVTLDPDLWACLTGPAGPPAIRAPERMADGPSGGASGTTADVFHPPRVLDASPHE